LGISQPYIARLESGEANPTIGAIGSLLATLDMAIITDAAPIFPADQNEARRESREENKRPAVKRNGHKQHTN
jgi:transcriptional regulator with XRE-family HTH domain